MSFIISLLLAYWKDKKMHWYMRKHPTPPRMPKRETEALLSILRDMRRVATMEDTNFFVFDEDSDEKMAEIRELTRLWRQSYLLSPLDFLISRYEKVAG